MRTLLLFLAVVLYSPLMAAASFWKQLPSAIKTGVIVLFVMATIAVIGAIIGLGILKKKLRTQAFQKAMAAWDDPAQVVLVTKHQSLQYLSPDALEEFASHLYTRMGYRAKRVGKTGDHGVDVYLLNPHRQIELVQCKQWHKPVGEPQVRDLYGAMMHANAVKGWLWAPYGFSEPARRWARGKAIQLLDDREIGRLIESVYGGVQ